jgi:hypothetical protein
MTTINPHTELLIACVPCGEVTRHVCPYAGAPLKRWSCERAAAHPQPRARWDLFLLSTRARPSHSCKPN